MTKVLYLKSAYQIVDKERFEKAFDEAARTHQDALVELVETLQQTEFYNFSDETKAKCLQFIKPEKWGLAPEKEEK